MDLHYYDTLIAVADDCPVDGAVVPALRGGKETVAVIQFEMISGAPGGLTQEDVLFETWLRRQESDVPSAFERAELRARFFSRSQACLRASPLPKKYGWGLLFDTAGRVTLCPMGSVEYQEIIAGEVLGITVLKAMRSKRA
ncbi:hypothetical protein Psi02_80250 [Planotetraspora silvatica]|uniref:Uncharacterized protein n=1 Tax=Planotetraspora silvatica TaxID=234614 RepID=A0A8J3UY36_9ACTN|nr:DUF6157 family protein [Planotetraspora silvatica]GII51601.1 hypothetical protein Psi02_80250 [Planotetraspora silvatica]